MTKSNHPYDPNRLLAALCGQLQVHSDTKLAKTLGLSTGILAGLRAGRVPITATMYLQMQEKTGIPIDTLRTLAGDQRRRQRPTGAVAAFAAARQGRVQDNMH